MKIFFKILIIVIVVLQINNINAQPPQNHQHRTPEERAKMETEVVKKEVSLNDSQVVKYELIALKYANMRGGFRNVPRDSMELFHAKMKDLNEKKTIEVKQILTPEQCAKYEKWMEENRNRMNRGRGDNPPPNPQ